MRGVHNDYPLPAGRRVARIFSRAVPHLRSHRGPLAAFARRPRHISASVCSSRLI